MKQTVRLATLMLLLIISMPVCAQMQWGVKGGMNISHLSFDSDKGTSIDRNGFFVGPMIEYTFPVGLGLDGSFMYCQRGMGDDELKQMGFDLPLNLKYTFGLGSSVGVYVAAGPDFYFDFKKNEKYNRRQRAMVGMNIGGGFKLFGHLQIGFNYNIPLGYSGEVTPGDALNATFGIGDYKNKTWQLSAAFLF